MDRNFLICTEYVVGDEQELFFCGEEITKLPEESSMYDVLVHAGIFTSKSQARKAGWLKEIPDGWSEHVVGKVRTRICIFKPDISNLPD